MRFKRVYIAAAAFGLTTTLGVFVQIAGTPSYGPAHDDVLRTRPVPAHQAHEPATDRAMPNWWYDPAGLRCAGPQCD